MEIKPQLLTLVHSYILNTVNTVNRSPYRNNAFTRPSDVGATPAPDIVIRI